MVLFLAECFATCIMILIGEGAIANYKFTQEPSQSTLPIAIAFGVGVYTALMLAAPIAGAQLNPALSISLLTIGDIKPLLCLLYVIAQVVGAFLGAVLVYVVYVKQFDAYDGGRREMIGVTGTADVFFTMPSEGIPNWSAFIDQVIGTGILMIFVLAVGNKSNQSTSKVIHPFAYALIVIGIISAFSINAGAAVNPARDFGPRIFGAFIYGWKAVFTVHDYYFWVPIVGPIVGAIIGVWVYQCYSFIVKKYGHLSDVEAPSIDIEQHVSSKF
ncbi:unnamed protein product [Adineta ricciae]|uniref:Uncharacterized protein n=1 Tax=Adineta ricciae TaxID=249248 RepID=A0A814TQR0_ADIRI|nr:unnamed protein product [Adineta ricciae]